MSRRDDGTRPWLGALLGILAVPLILFAVVAFVRSQHDDKPLPGTTVLGESIGGESRAEAEATVQRLAERPVTLSSRSQTLRTSAARTGATIDVDDTVDRAIEAGRGNTPRGVLSTLRGLVAEREIEPSAAIEPPALRAFVRTVARRFGRRAFDGSVVVDATSLVAEVERPRPGRSVDRERLRGDLERAPVTGQRDIAVRTEELEALRLRDVERVGDEAEAYAQEPLRLRVGDRTVTIEPARVAPLLALRRADDRRAALGVRPVQLAALVKSVAEQVDRPARSPRFSVRGDGVTLDGKGDVRWRPRSASVSVAPGRSGLSVRRDATRRAITNAVADGRHVVRVSLERKQPSVSAQAARRVNRLVGTFTTRFQPGQPRVQNIRRIAGYVDGSVVAPGASFSLNETAGPRTTQRGYVNAPTIENGKLVDTIGGGVSQFSTTLYNAAYFAGLRLDAFQPHSFFIDRYPPGRESTLDFDSIDLRFTNDTDTAILIRAAAGTDSVRVSLYGNNGGRIVRADAGERVGGGDGGFSITVTRVVRYANGKVTRNPVTTRYVPAP